MTLVILLPSITVQNQNLFIFNDQYNGQILHATLSFNLSKEAIEAQSTSFKHVCRAQQNKQYVPSDKINNMCLLQFETLFASHRFRYVDNSNFIFHSVRFSTFKVILKLN